jgi:L-2-hydroxyglutarate oxidase
MFDFAIIGGGIVGLATAWQISRARPELKLIVVEKERTLAAHQTGRNSGVIHSGIYYRPGSLRARNCREGKRALEVFCDRQGVAWRQTGKVIVATQAAQLAALQGIFERGQQNGVRCELIDRDKLVELEPHCGGIRAIHVPESGIVDYPGVCEALARLLRAAGCEIRMSTEVTTMIQHAEHVVLQTTGPEVLAKQVVNCGGLHSDRLARMSGQHLHERIVPFRGEYFVLSAAASHLCRSLIYPVPDPAFPFLGVHFTRMIEGGVECGPNAVLALAREGYSWSRVNVRDVWDAVTYAGFWRLAARNWRTGLKEIHRSLSKAAFVRALQELVPEIRSEHLQSAPAGVRAQALGMDGRLLDDFLVVRHQRVVNVCNAPSPAATACLTIGMHIASQALGIPEGPAI